MLKRAIFVMVILVLVACNGIAPPRNDGGDLPAGSESEGDTNRIAAVEDDGAAGDSDDDPTEAPSEDPVEAPSSDSSSDRSGDSSGDGSSSEPTEAPTEAPPPGEEPAVFAATGFLLEDVGFSTPESMLHDPVADVYLVSNINGSPIATDNNGFISQVSPDGTLQTLKWIEGGVNGVSLHAPKGMALTDDYLWVSDVTVVRLFDRATGTPMGEVEIAGSVFLNDVATAPDGSIWVTDSSLGNVYRIAPDMSYEQKATVASLNGIAFFNTTPLVTSGMSIMQIASDGTLSEVEPVPSGNLDGLVVFPNGALAVSSWGGSNVYLIHSGGTDEVISGVVGPADIGVDIGRSLILIPHFSNDRVQAVPLPIP